MQVLIDDIEGVVYFGSSVDLCNRFAIKFENFLRSEGWLLLRSW